MAGMALLALARDENPFLWHKFVNVTGVSISIFKFMRLMKSFKETVEGVDHNFGLCSYITDHFN